MVESERPRILWIHPGGLLPVGGGGATRTWALIDFLRDAGYAVELLTGDQGEHNEELEGRVDRLWIESRDDDVAVSLPPSRRDKAKALYRKLDPELCWLPFFQRVTGGKIGAASHMLARNRRPALERYAGVVAYAQPPVAAIVSYAWLAPALDHMPPGTLRILDTIDIQHARRENARSAGGNLDHVVCTRNEEIQALKRADLLLAIQEAEGATLESMCPDCEVLVAGHAHVVPDYEPSPPTSCDLLYVGNRYDPNVLGLRSILDDVWPKVRKACPEATLTVCGRVGESIKGQHGGVQVLGQVPDLAPYYHRAAIVLNPVPYGTGLKIKTVEALAHGRAVVSSLAGTGGLGDPTELPLVVAESAAAMTKSILRLLASPAERHELEKKAWHFARDRFGADQVYGALAKRLAAHCSERNVTKD